MPVINTLKNTEREYTKYLQASFPSGRKMENFYFHFHSFQNFSNVCNRNPLHPFIILEMCFGRKQRRNFLKCQIKPQINIVVDRFQFFGKVALESKVNAYILNEYIFITL